jgi:hypothetical protein
MSDMNSAIQQVFNGLLSRDRDPSPTLVILMMGDISGMSKDEIVAKREQVVNYLKSSRNTMLDWFDEHKDIIHYQAACNSIYKREG